ncbi:hypothetical protein VPH35_031678 [Triticum aestivum]
MQQVGSSCGVGLGWCICQSQLCSTFNRSSKFVIIDVVSRHLSALVCVPYLLLKSLVSIAFQRSPSGFKSYYVLLLISCNDMYHFCRTPSVNNHVEHFILYVDIS